MVGSLLCHHLLNSSRKEETLPLPEVSLRNRTAIVFRSHPLVSGTRVLSYNGSSLR